MRILLTGGAGFIGSHTAVEMTKSGHEVVIYDNFCNSDASVLERLEEILGKPVTFEEGDIRDYSRMHEVLKKHQIEAVVHFAGLKAVGESVEKPLEYYDNNITGTSTLFALSSHQAPRFMVRPNICRLTKIIRYRSPIRTDARNFRSKKFCPISV